MLLPLSENLEITAKIRQGKQCDLTSRADNRQPAGMFLSESVKPYVCVYVYACVRVFPSRGSCICLNIYFIVVKYTQPKIYHFNVYSSVT